MELALNLEAHICFSSSESSQYARSFTLIMYIKYAVHMICLEKNVV